MAGCLSLQACHPQHILKIPTAVDPTICAHRLQSFRGSTYHHDSCACPAKLEPGRLHVQDTEKGAPQHAAIAKDGTLRTLLSLFMPHLQLTAQTMKLQANAGALNSGLMAESDI